MITEKIMFRGKEVEILKIEHFVDSMKLSKSQSTLAKKEKDDCVVRAFMSALDIPYNQAHTWIKKYLKRENNKATYLFTHIKNIVGITKNGYKISFIGSHPSRTYINNVVGSNKILINKQYKKATGYTLKSFMENHPVGRFVLIVQGHAVAVVDGVLYGNTGEDSRGLYRSVWLGFECK